MLCPHCHRWLDDAPDLAGQQCACPTCGGMFLITGSPPAPTQTVVHHHYYGKRGKDKSAGMVAALLSFLIPGLGQLCQGRIGIGALVFAGTVLGIVMGFLFAPLFLLAIGFWLWAIADAAWAS